MPRAHFLQPLLQRPRLALPRLWVERLGVPLATTLEGAFDSASRKRGLLGRRVFAEGGAMIIAPSSAVHTWFMKFPIDVVFAARDGRVVKIASRVRPWRIAVGWGAYAAIELPAGTAEQCGLRVEDRLRIVDGQLRDEERQRWTTVDSAGRRTIAPDDERQRYLGAPDSIRCLSPSRIPAASPLSRRSIAPRTSPPYQRSSTSTRDRFR